MATNVTLSVSNTIITASTTEDVVNVSSTTNNVTVGTTPTTSNADIRVALSNVDPVLYNSTTGVISLNNTTLLSGQTTNNLTEGSNNKYFSTSGAAVNTDNLPEGSSNKYLTNAAVQAVISANITAGPTGILTKQANNQIFANTDGIRALINGGIGLDYDASTGSMSVANSFLSVGAIQFLEANGEFFVRSDTNTGDLKILGANTSNAQPLSIHSVATNGVGSNLSISAGNIDLTPKGGWSGGSIFGVRGDTANSGIYFGNGTASNVWLTDGTDVRLTGYTVVESPFHIDSTTGNTRVNSLTVAANAGLTRAGNLTAISSDITLDSQNDLGIRSAGANINMNATEIHIGADTGVSNGFRGNIITKSNVKIDGFHASTGDESRILFSNATSATSTLALTNTTITGFSSDSVTPPSGTFTITGEGSVTGNLVVGGNIDYTHVNDLFVANNEIIMNANASTDTNVTITVNRPQGGTNAHLRWNETADYWEIFDASNTFIIPRSTSDLAEGTNQYFTTARSNTATQAYLSGGYGITISGSGAISTTNADVRGLITATGNIDYDAANGVISESLTTTDITEGDNQYFTTARANSAIGAYTGTLTNLTGNVTTTANVSASHFIGSGTALTGVVPEALDTGKLLVGSTSNTAIGVTPQTNFVTTSNAISLSNNLTDINSIKGEENANVVLSGQAVNKIQVSTTTQFGVGNYFTDALGGGTQGVIFDSDPSIADGTAVNITGFEDSGGNNAANLNGSYFLKSFGSGFERIKLLFADANLSVATNAAIVGGSQTLSPAGFLDTGTTHGNININSATDAVIDTTLTVDKQVSVGGDISGSGNLQIKEFNTSRAGTNFNFIRGNGTEASQTELNQGDEIMAFRSEGTQNRYDASTKQLRISTIQRIEVDNPNTFKSVPSLYAMGGQRVNTKTFDGGLQGSATYPSDFNNFGFRLGSTEIDSSKTYLQDSIVATPGEVFAPKGLTVGNETALQEGLEDAELQIGHTDTDVTIPVRFNNSYQANSGIQFFSTSGTTVNFLSRGTGNLNGDQVCVELWSNLKPEADYEFQGYQEGWIADGSKLTVPATSVTVNGPTGALANIGNSSITGASNNEFYVKGVASYALGKIYALFTDSSMANALTWSTLGGGTPNVNGENLGGFGNVTYKTGDYSMIMASGNVDTSANGSGANFVITKSGTTYSVGAPFSQSPAAFKGDVFNINMLAGGSNFVVGETCTIDGTHLGGASGTNNLTFTVDSVDGNGNVLSIGNVTGTGHDVTTDKWSIKKAVTSSELEITNNNVGTATRRVNLTSNVILNLASHSNTQILAFTGNVAGDIVYNSTDNLVAYHDGTNWRNLAQGAIIT